MMTTSTTTGSSSTSSWPTTTTSQVGDTVHLLADRAARSSTSPSRASPTTSRSSATSPSPATPTWRTCRSRSTSFVFGIDRRGRRPRHGDGRHRRGRSSATSRTSRWRTGTGFIGSIADQITFFVNFISIMLLLSIVIALIGVANTLSLSISERVRELGLLRAVGMNRTQLKRSIRWEAVIMSVLGTAHRHLPGARHRPGDDEGARAVRAARCSGSRSASLVVLLLGGAAVGTIAAIFPARRAAKLADPRRHRPRVTLAGERLFV